MRQFRVIIEWQGEAGYENELKNTRLAQAIVEQLRNQGGGLADKILVYAETGPEERAAMPENRGSPLSPGYRPQGPPGDTGEPLAPKPRRTRGLRDA